MEHAHPDNFKLTVLVENSTRSAALIGEHGFSIHIETGHGSGLFDTGQTGAPIENAVTLGIDLARLDWIVLSHGHYDHCGGLPAVLDNAPNARVVSHPDAFLRKYVVCEGGGHRDAGMPITKAELEARGVAMRLDTRPVRVAPKIWTTGEVARTNAFETIPERFAIDRGNGAFEPDPFADDMSLVLETSEGLVVLLGCSHAGVVNIVNHIGQWWPGQSIHALIGGMHLHEADSDRIDRTVRIVKGRGINVVGPGHCTGETAVERFRETFGRRCVTCSTGQTFLF